MAVVTAKIHDRATLIQQLFEWQSFSGEFRVDLCGRFARIVLGANRTGRDRCDVLGNQSGHLRRDFLKRVFGDVKRGLRSQ